MGDTTFAEIAYEAYGRSVGFKNYQGNPMPTWEQLPEAIRNAWIAATQAVMDSVTASVLA